MSKFFAKKTLTWTPEKEQILWSVPDDQGSTLKGFNEFVVNENEIATFNKDGKLEKIFNTGRHRVIDTDEITFIKTSEFKQVFGIPQSLPLLTKDRKQIGFWGYLTLRIGDTNDEIIAFLENIAQDRQKMQQSEIIDFLLQGVLPSIFKDIVGGMRKKAFIGTTREDMMRVLRSKLNIDLMKYGLRLVSFDFGGHTD